MATDFAFTKSLFHLPEEVIYLDGNSLGPVPKAVPARVHEMLTSQWGEKLIRGWNEAGWMEQPSHLGVRIAKLIGAPGESVVLGDTLSIKVFQALSAALALRPGRKVILSDNGNFPTDLYMAEGLISALDHGHELRIVAPEEVEAAIGDDVAVLLLTHVDYRTGRMHDMERLTARAQAAGALTIWDLAHSAGAVPLDVAAAGADFSCGCTYKYLNSGPGGPAFIHVAPHLVDQIDPVLSGWLGHDEPFAFAPQYRPGRGIERMRVGTPPVIQMAALDAALDVWDHADIGDVREKSITLSEMFRKGVEESCPSLQLASPKDPAERGSQISFRFEHGYAVMQALIGKGVIGDFRAPDIIRFGFAPLYIDEADTARAIDILAAIMADDAWDRPEYHKRSLVT